MKNKEKYPILNLEFESAQLWWDSLTSNEKIDVGSVAMHFNKISANYKWNTYLTFEALKRGQQSIIKSVYKTRNETFYMFPNANINF